MGENEDPFGVQLSAVPYGGAIGSGCVSVAPNSSG